MDSKESEGTLEVKRSLGVVGDVGGYLYWERSPRRAEERPRWRSMAWSLMYDRKASDLHLPRYLIRSSGTPLMKRDIAQVARAVCSPTSLGSMPYFQDSRSIISERS